MQYGCGTVSLLGQSELCSDLQDEVEDDQDDVGTLVQN